MPTDTTSTLQQLGEQWRAIPAHPMYEVSSLGNVRSWICRWGRRKTPQDIVCREKDDRGYTYFTLRYNHCKTEFSLSRTILTCFVGAAPSSRHQAAHNDGNPRNNTLSNLRWATPKENHHDKIGHGTLPLGENCNATKLTEQQVREIRKRYVRGSKTSNARLLGQDYGVHECTIGQIVNGKAWTHIN